MTKILYDNFRGNRAKNLAEPLADKDAVTKYYVDVTLIERIYPVGAIYISTLATNPATLFGFGTWEVFGAGKTLVGLDSGDADFDTAEETGGEKTHTLTGAESGEKGHNHTQNAHGHAIRVQWGGDGGANVNSTSGAGVPWRIDQSDSTSGTTATNQAVSASNATSAHNNVQPYIVVYFWKRTN